MKLSYPVKVCAGEPISLIVPLLDRLQPVSSIIGYAQDETLSESANSFVYRAHRIVDGARVVIKQNRADKPPDAALSALQGEFSRLRNVSDKRIVRAHTLIRCGATAGLILEDVPGARLAELIRDAELTLSECVWIAAETAAALAALHESGMVHLDVTPDNILYCRETTRLTLLDLSHGAESPYADAHVTRSNVAGSLKFVAPERLDPEVQVDHRADLYSFGVTLYMLFGSVLESLAEHELEIGRTLTRLLAKLTQESPEDRYDSAGSVELELRRWLGNSRNLLDERDRHARQASANNVNGAEKASENARSSRLVEDILTSERLKNEGSWHLVRDVSARASMAEVALGAIHDIANVMNSANTGLSMALEMAERLPGDRIGKVCDLLHANAENLGEYLSLDSSGQKLPGYLRALGDALAQDRQALVDELKGVRQQLEHMQQILAAQQLHARGGSLADMCALEEITEAAIGIVAPVLRDLNIDIERSFDPIEPITIDRQRVLQILVNLLSNAAQALKVLPADDRRLSIAVSGSDREAFIIVADNGAGIDASHLTQIFELGFSTKPKGLGIGLHSSMNAARAMGATLIAESEGPGHGARFMLTLARPAIRRQSGS